MRINLLNRGHLSPSSKKKIDLRFRPLCAMPRSPFAMLRSLWFDISILITVSSSLCVKFFASAAKCYYPNGSPVLSGEYQPCVSISSSSSSSMVDSMCCATNRTAGISAFHKDYCLSNGLCHNPCSIDNRCNDLPGHFWRETCTDATWNSPFCLKGICANDDVSWEILQKNNFEMQKKQSTKNGRLCEKTGDWFIK